MESPTPHPVRVTDAARSATMQRLADAMSAGALTPTEFDQRTQLAVAAVTTADLEPITRDLPAAPVDPSAQKDKDLRDWLIEWQWWLGSAVLLNGIWAVQWVAKGEAPRYWPLLPLGIWAVILLAIAVWPRPADPTTE